MASSFDFQTIIITLQRYWAEQGCLIWQPYNQQVGAGTMNPATVLRVLGPEPWKVAYVEPSVRPDDGRYGKNPNRLQQHYQFQVILKPDPGNPQELYLKSLEALGIDPRRHDIRFVEDNWESPALGAWGLGWEVWLDGQEITQFTYFQQAGGMVLDPVSVEITYGLERIAMPLQRVRNFRNIQWSPTLTYGDVNLAAEQQHSQYYFENANVERLRQMYTLYEQEAEAALEAGLVLPANDYILKCSHTFNVLDTRGAVGVTERQALFGRMRDLSRRVAEAYAAERQALEYPWLPKESAAANITNAPAFVPDQGSEARRPFLFEIGTEELPAADLQSALSQLNEAVPALLDELRLAHGEISILGTPRRLVVSVADLAGLQTAHTSVVKGPPANRAFDANGVPTKAGEGFARSRGLDPKDLQVQTIDGGEYVVAMVEEPRHCASQALAEALPGLIAKIHFDKTMRWNSSNVAFSRPIRWLLALFGDYALQFSYAGYHSGHSTRGLRFRDPETIEVKNPEAYFSALAAQGIILDSEKRKATIAAQVKAIIQAAGGKTEIDPALLDEVNTLVEAPVALRGSFGEEYLQLPAAVLVSVMKKHQRYFPIYDNSGSLLPYFIAVRNGDDQHLDVVADGNEQVIGARFADAAFFIDEDLKHRLEDLLPRLATLTFQYKLGSMLDKTQRIEKLAAQVAAMLKLDGKELDTIQRAAHLCKADLVSHMVVEMTSVQGIMGKHYALKSGEKEAVAEAIYEHYLPRYTGDEMPKTPAGLAIGLADRLDSLAGLFAAGLAPSGTKDPFAQRRAALGLVQTLIEADLDFDLGAALKSAAANLPVTGSPESLGECLEFISGRLRSYLLDQNYRYDVVDAILAVQKHNPAGAKRAIVELSAWVTRPDWATILPAYARCVRITRDQKEQYPVNPAAFVEAEEKTLWQAIQKVEGAPRRQGSVAAFLEAFTPIIPAVNSFFDKVLVMAEDPAVRANRLGMLQHIAALAGDCGDFSVLEGF